ncbi:HIRA-interacting protein 3 isoform X2 [Centroberyx affinis]
MKRVVEEELMKMQDSDKDISESESPPAAPRQNKRKREKESEEETSRRVVDEGESRAKKLRRQLSSSEDCKTGSEESDEDEQINKIGEGDEEQRVRKSQEKTNGISEEERNSEDCAEEERNVSEKRKQGKISAEDSSDDDEKRMVKKRAKNTQNGGKRSKNTSEGEESSPSQRDGEDEIGTDGKKENTQRKTSSEEDSEKEGKVLKEKKNAELVEDSDSSSLPSLEDEQDSGTEKSQLTKKKKTKEKKEDSENIPKGEKDGNKAVLRLKRYIGLCGVRRNYKKLLGGCRSIRAKVAVLKKELEDLGVEGQPSIKKCKNARLKREDAQEVAGLDVSNIITTHGRPKRRASAWQKQPVPPSSTYQHMVNSSSDSDEPSRTGRGRRRASDWGNLQGIISDDGDSG